MLWLEYKVVARRATTVHAFILRILEKYKDKYTNDGLR
jgi:hypothetical protein